jgi:hypothetical protein
MKKAVCLVLMIVVSISYFNGCIKQSYGTLVLQITDAPGDLNITEALVKISHIAVHSVIPSSNSSAGWYIIVEDAQIFDLIAIKDVKEFLGSENLRSGWYTQIRLNVVEALVTIDGIQYNLTIPSKTIKLISPFSINESKTTTLTLDFEVNESVHETGNEKYIFNPTIKVIKE